MIGRDNKGGIVPFGLNSTADIYLDGTGTMPVNNTNLVGIEAPEVPYVTWDGKDLKFDDAPVMDPPGELEIWPLVGQTVKVKVKRATHSLRVPRELETEDEMWVLVEPITYEPKE